MLSLDSALIWTLVEIVVLIYSMHLFVPLDQDPQHTLPCSRTSYVLVICEWFFAGACAAHTHNTQAHFMT